MNATDLFRRPTTFLGVLRIIGLVIAGLAMAVLIAFLFGYFIMLLWNWLMPAIFGLGTITYWQAFGIALLARLLFGKVGGDSNHSRRNKKQYPSRNCSDDRKGDFRRWKHFESFWDERGKEAFDEYITGLGNNVTVTETEGSSK